MRNPKAVGGVILYHIGRAISIYAGRVARLRVGITVDRFRRTGSLEYLMHGRETMNCRAIQQGNR
jgi:hypothetical protein